MDNPLKEGLILNNKSSSWAIAAALVAASLSFVTPASAHSTPDTSASNAAGINHCEKYSRAYKTKKRTAVHYGPSSGSRVTGHLSKGTAVKSKWRCKNSSGNYWACYKSCVIDVDVPVIKGKFVYTGHLRRV
ncbi:hypothetical protein ACGFSB_36285 [Streptomyces sp. NPDC048441]|uniref:hypothetical protein n=1 Tax=Streptomyces sp. NPDC048441 TaxID=3365552 RepID=UPI00372063F7